MIRLLLVLQSLGFQPLQDSVALKATADSFSVPVEVAYSIAWMETRNGKRWNALGPGIIDTTWLADGTLKVRRVCRELGRYQLRGCQDWTKILEDSRCTHEGLARNYAIGIHCGIENLARLYRTWHSWLEVIRHQNGSGPLADRYVREALAYIGWREIWRDILAT